MPASTSPTFPSRPSISIDTVFELRSCHAAAHPACSSSTLWNTIYGGPQMAQETLCSPFDHHQPCLSHHHHHPGAFMGNFFACCISLPTTRLSFTSGLWMRPSMLTRKPTVGVGAGFSCDACRATALFLPCVQGIGTSDRCAVSYTHLTLPTNREV